MKVYVAERYTDYEGFSILGVYSTKEAAEAANARDIENGDHHDIEEYELDTVKLSRWWRDVAK